METVYLLSTDTVPPLPSAKATQKPGCAKAIVCPRQDFASLCSLLFLLGLVTVTTTK